jgi:hypothetical protein
MPGNGRTGAVVETQPMGAKSAAKRLVNKSMHVSYSIVGVALVGWHAITKICTGGITNIRRIE